MRHGQDEFIRPGQIGLIWSDKLDQEFILLLYNNIKTLLIRMNNDIKGVSRKMSQTDRRRTN